MVDFPIVNGNRYSYVSLTAYANGTPYRGIKSLSYKDNLDPAGVYGASVQMSGATRGQYKAEADVEMYLEEWHDFRDALGDGFMEVQWPLDAQYEEAGRGVHSVQLPAVRISGVDDSHSEGTDGLTVKLKLFVLLPILRDGLAPFRGAVT